MSALEPIKPSVKAVRQIASVAKDYKEELGLPAHMNSIGLLTADSDDVTYIAADEATKQAQVEVVYGRSLYAGAAHSSSPTAGEVIIMLGGPTPAEVKAGLDAMVATIEIRASRRRISSSSASWRRSQAACTSSAIVQRSASRPRR